MRQQKQGGESNLAIPMARSSKTDRQTPSRGLPIVAVHVDLMIRVLVEKQPESFPMERYYDE